MRLPLAVGLCCALLAALAIGWASARADESSGAESSPAPLEVTFYADAKVCTAGSMMAVHWEISGGAEPYQATLNGEPVDASSNSAPVPCGPAYDIPAWLRGIVQPPPINVDLTVLDAAGSETTHNLTLERAPPLPAPRVHLRVYNTCGVNESSVSADAHGIGLGADRSRRYLVRWRPVGLTEWNYDTHTDESQADSYDDVFRYDTTGTGASFAAQVAQVRSLAEQTTPDLLNWSPVAYATTVSPPLDLTARATHDTITISWGPAVEGLVWTAAVSPMDRQDPDRDRRWLGWDRSKWSQSAVGPALSYEASYDGLLPDTLYRVWVGLDHNCYCFGDTEGACAASRGLTVRTAPAPPGWSREPRRPQNVRATAHPGGVGFVVAWDPPLEGEERAYTVTAHEYGTPRPDPITPVGGVGGPSYVVRLPRDTTYEVFVRQLGIEDEEARVIVTPPPTESENIDEYMTLPDWHVAHRRPEYSERDRRGYKFIVTWDTEDRDDTVQVGWLKDGYIMRRSAERPPIAIWAADPGPHSFQLRLRRYGSWSQWSSALRASVPPLSPESLSVRERQGTLVISWSLPVTSWSGYRYADHNLLLDHIDGFRVYLHRTGSPVRVLDVGTTTNAEFPILADGGEYEVHVASYSDTLGESRATVQTFSQAAGPTLHLSDKLDSWYSGFCVPSKEMPVVVHWQVLGGAAPYTIRIGANPGFETTDWEGYAELQCDPADTRAETLVEATVTDAYGRTAEATHQYRIVHPNNHAASREYWRDWVDGLALGRAYVEKDSIVLRWNRFVGSWLHYAAHPDSPLFIVRWRKIGADHWHYRDAADMVANNCLGGSRWTLEGLTSSTEYEVQVALDLLSVGILDDEPLDWTESHIARTLPDAIRPTLQRRGSDIIVSWSSITEATDYAVTLHADGVSWWKVYEPLGGALEQAVFVDIPVALDETLRAEIEVTAAISADQGGPVIEDYAYCD